MRRKINVMLVSVAGTAILLTLLLVTVVCYDLFRKQVFEDLRVYTKFFDMLGKEGIPADWKMIHKYSGGNLRITIVQRDGTVLFDTRAVAANLDNHGNRTEIKEAFEKGFGKSVRKSPTYHRSTFYYARRLDADTVLRISREAAGILGIFFGVLPVLALIAAVLFAVCMLTARFLTKKLLAPIGRLADQLDSGGEADTYRELQPFVQTIRRQHEAILQSARMRQDFTANVSHELKTPLTAISGYAELIESGLAQEKDIVHFASEIQRSSKRLLTLINDIIRLSELDIIRDDIVFEKIDLSEIAQVCVDMLQINAEKHNVTATFSGAPCFVNANHDMMEELLYNLTGNAIRYNRSGGSVAVEVEQAGDEIILSVRDTGIGIPKEHQERIFERFYRVDKSRSKSTGGTGLGLAIVKHIVEKHGARMVLTSEPGEGTEIRVYFAAAEPRQ